MDLKDFFPAEEIEKAKKFIKIFHGQILIDEKLSDPKAILLISYMLANKNKASSITYNSVKDIFVKSGRDEKNFTKTLYDLSKRQMGKNKAQFLVTDKKKNISLTFSGIKEVESLFSK